MDVGVWLRGLDLAQYEAAFRENEIDDAVLSMLTVKDLKDIGVAAAGHRRKIMSAIEKLNAPSAARGEAKTKSSTQIAIAAVAPPDAAERPDHRHGRRPRRLDCAVGTSGSRGHA